MKFWILFTLISSFAWIGSGQNTDQEIDKLIQKICKIATEKLHVNNYTPEERIRILHILKQKFLTAAKSRGFETSYIRLIVQGVSILVNEDNYQKLCKNPVSDIERRIIYKKLTTESVNFTLTDITLSNETAIDVSATNITFNKTDISDQNMDNLFSNIDTLIKKTIEKSPTSKAEEVNVQKVEHRFLEAHKDEVNFTKQLEVGVDKAIEKHMSERRLFDDGYNNTNITNPVSQNDSVKEPFTKVKLFNESEKATERDKAKLNAKIDILIKKTVNNSPLEKLEINTQKVKQKFLESFKKIRGNEVNFTNQLEIGVDKAIKKHISLRRMFDMKPGITKEPPANRRKFSHSDIAIDQEKAKLFSKIESLVMRTIDKSSFDTQERNVLKVKRKFLENFQKSHRDEVNFINQLEKRFDESIFKCLNMRRSNGRNVTHFENSEAAKPDVTKPNVKETITLESKMATDQDKAKLFSKINALVQKTIDKSPSDKQEQNVEQVKRRFLTSFRKSHKNEDKFIELLEKRFDEARDKHLVIRKMNVINPNLHDESRSYFDPQISDKSGILTNINNATFITKIETLIKSSINKSPLEKQGKNLQEVKRRFLEDYRKSHIDDINLLEKIFDETKEKYLSMQKNKNIEVQTWDRSAQIAEEALMESGIIIANKKRKPKIINRPITTQRPFSGVTKEYNTCSDVLENACNDLNNLDTFTCENDRTLTISSIQVCDGNTDCTDGSDERNCIQQVISKIHGATSVMSKLELHRNCLKSLIENSLLARQENLLSSLLNSQVIFLQKYSEKYQNSVSTPKTMSKAHLRDFRKYDIDPVNTIVNEMAVIVRTFKTTLVKALCMNNRVNVLKGIDKITNLETDVLQRTQKWSPYSCVCDGAYCANLTNCNLRCQNLCFKLQALTEFSCTSVQKGQNSIPMDLVCDGKVDCYDEADEENCPDTEGLSGIISLTSTARFEGGKIFNNIITYLNEIAITREFDPGRGAMTNFALCIQHLHKLSIAVTVDLKAFRSRRDQCLSILKDIYTSVISEIEDEKTQAKAYDFSMTLGKKLIEGLRQTHFGNEKLASSDLSQCFCSGPECVRMHCSSECSRECFVKHALTQYPCSSSNVTIPVNDLCNKIINCPKAEDETSCNEDVCRNYHVKVLRVNIKKLRDDYRTSTIGKILERWGDKVAAELGKLERSESRLSPETYKQIINTITNDLASTFFKFEVRLGHQSNGNLKKFSQIATQIMESAKTCTL